MSVFKERHVINNLIVEAVQLVEGEDYTEFLAGVEEQEPGQLEDWLIETDATDWLLRRGNKLFRMDDEFYCNFFGKVVE